ncbi:phosphotransferase [Siccirubricoccus sp. KC 17139]|uniref:Phosphotransferase n=1 Tax=Siccirubricoccus soli TaxID=2899147 RepID=A0ABT1DAH6_9PROT|nr:phosphotransferase [Siccirubricoccus soli]MCO6418947.1 phosphotransferase [Siccirubricoccus soli]MCP2685082.1 phosphotransferase [Siccirubricoccus soli]
MSAAAAYLPAARQALAAFGVMPAELRFVRLSENATFLAVDARDGAKLVLRLHRPTYHALEELRSEHLWTRALVQAGVATPEPLATLAGEAFAQVEIAATREQRWAGLARWVEGELLAEVVAREGDAAANLARFRGLGALIAAMHNQATGWAPPAGFRRHRLDAEGLMGETPFWGPFWDHPIFSAAERRLMLATRDALHGVLTRYGEAPERFSLIHADLHPRNVLVDGTRVAVIDFDDAGYGWHLYDLAVALIDYQLHPQAAALREAVLAGYRSVRPLAEADAALLPMFQLIRDMAQIGWYLGRPELPPSRDLPQLKDYVLRRAAGFTPPL